jgi:hypothetical protein
MYLPTKPQPFDNQIVSQKGVFVNGWTFDGQAGITAG